MASREDVNGFMATEVSKAAHLFFESGTSSSPLVRAGRKELYLKAVENKDRFDKGDNAIAYGVIKARLAEVEDDLKRMEVQADDIPKTAIAAGILALTLEKDYFEDLLAAVD